MLQLIMTLTVSTIFDTKNCNKSMPASHALSSLRMPSHRLILRLRVFTQLLKPTLSNARLELFPGLLWPYCVCPQGHALGQRNGSLKAQIDIRPLLPERQPEISWLHAGVQPANPSQTSLRLSIFSIYKNIYIYIHLKVLYETRHYSLSRSFPFSKQCQCQVLLTCNPQVCFGLSHCDMYIASD